jgi:hypothetical protein
MPGFAIQTTDAREIKGPSFMWDPPVGDILSNNFTYFYGLKFNPSSGRLELQEVDDDTVPISIPDYRQGVGECACGTVVYSDGDPSYCADCGRYLGSEARSITRDGLLKHEVYDYADSVYKNWFVTKDRVTLTWSDTKPTHIVLEVH